jgi:hypothetical protein
MRSWPGGDSWLSAISHEGELRMNIHNNARTARSIEPHVEGASRRPQFARFVAAMEANPPQKTQMLDEVSRDQLQPAPSGAAETTVNQSSEAWARTNPKFLWLAIVSWALACAALFVSLLPWQDRDAFERSLGLRPERIQGPVTDSDAPKRADRGQRDPTPSSQELLPTDRLEVVSARRHQLHASPAPQRAAEPRLEEDDPIPGDADAGVIGGPPPLPRLKPAINRAPASIPGSDAENVGSRAHFTGSD